MKDLESKEPGILVDFNLELERLLKKDTSMKVSLPQEEQELEKLLTQKEEYTKAHGLITLIIVMEPE